MKDLNLEGTEDTPEIKLDKEKQIFYIGGRSLPENSVEFYDPILKWLSEYAEDPNVETKFEFELEYFNTSSSKLILDVLSKLEEIEKVNVVWYFQEDDEDMKEAGEEFSELVEVDFEIKEKPDD